MATAAADESTDAYVSQFLLDTGAAAIGADLSANATSSIGQLRARIDAEVKATHASIAEKTRRDHFARLKTNGERLVQRLASLNAEAGLLPTLVDAVARHADISERAAQTRAQYEALSALDQCHRAVADFAALIDAGRLREAVERSRTVDRTLREDTASWIRDSSSWQASQIWFDRLQAALHDRLIEAREAVVRFTDDGALAVRQSVVASPGASAQTTLAEVFDALHVIKPKALEAAIAKLAQNILQRLARPTLQHGRSINVRSSESEASVALDSSGAKGLTGLIVLLDFISEHLLARSDLLKTSLPPLLGSQIQSLVIELALLPALPETISSTALAMFQQTLDQALSVEAALHRNGLLSSTQPQLIREWVSRAGEHWAHRRAEMAARALKSLITKMDWEATVVDWREHRPESVKPAPTEQPRSVPVEPPIEHVEPSHVATESTPPIEADAWGFDASPAPSTRHSRQSTRLGGHSRQPSRTQGSEGIPEDAWGFDGGPSTPQSSKRQSTVSHPKTPKEADASAWGLDEDIDEAEPSLARNRSGSSSGWDLGDDEDFATPAETTPAPETPAAAEDDGWGFAEGGDETMLADEHDVEPVAVSPAKKPIVSTRRGLGRPKSADPEPEPEPEPAPVPIVPLDLAPPTETQVESDASWKWDDDEPKLPSPPARPATPPLERFSISVKSRDVVSLADALLEDARTAAQSHADIASTVLQTAAPYLIDAFRTFFDLYRAILPVQHGSLVASVPALGMQFANDCDWIAAQIVERAQAGSHDAELVTETATELSLCAYRVRLQQISTQRAALNECLDEANRFYGTSEPAKFATARRAVKQVGYTLERLAAVWRSVLTAQAFDAALGSLVNDVYARVLDEITAQDDISEVESGRLNEICKSLHSLQDLFVAGAEQNSTIGDHVPLFFKFVYLSELLEASMADFQYLFTEGNLVDFTKDEIIRLVRALFADSPNRAKFLETIRASELYQ